MIDRTWHKTACNLCYVNCGIEVAVDGEGQAARITKIRGDADNPKSAGYLCNKAQGIVSYVHHRDRLTTPLKRRADGTFEAISWESAISEIAARLRQVTSHAGGARASRSMAAAVRAIMPAVPMPPHSCAISARVTCLMH